MQQTHPTEPQAQEKIKVLWLSDFLCATGFAQVAHNVLRRLLATDKYDVTVIGINHHGEPYDWNEWPIKVYPARYLPKIADPRYADLFGRQRLLDELGTGQYDLLFTLQDSFILESIAAQIVETRKQLVQLGQKGFNWIYYYPIDSIPKENWITQSVALADFPVAYTEFGKAETLKHAPNLNVDVIYHGVDTKVFRPLDEKEIEDFKDQFFKGNHKTADGKNKFIVMNLNRNQRRKDIPRTIAAFAQFKKRCPDSLLYLHMRYDDNGGDIREMARHYGLKPMEDYVYPGGFSEHNGYPLDVVNFLYNAADVVVSTTLGEGWGLSTVEAMAAKTPIIMPNNTSLKEICADGRGKLVDSGASDDDWVCLGPEDMNQYRPVTSIRSLADALEDAYKNPDKYKKQAEIAYKWVLEKANWDLIAQQWDAVFTQAFASLPTTEVAGSKVQRNDPCPECQAKGVTKKWKKCKVHNPEFNLVEG